MAESDKTVTVSQSKAAFKAFIGSLLSSVVFDREDDGRVMAEIEALPGCLVYGASEEEAARRVQALALRVIADQIEHGELDLK